MTPIMWAENKESHHATMHCAACSFHACCTRYLAEHGAEVDYVNKADQSTPLHLGAELGLGEAITILVAAVADVEKASGRCVGPHLLESHPHC